MGKLTIVANIKANEDRVDLIRSELEKLVDTTRSEKGCIQYDLHQDNTDPAHFLVYEIWETKEAWQDHMNTQHFKDFSAAIDGAVKEFSANEMTQIA